MTTKVSWQAHLLNLLLKLFLRKYFKQCAAADSPEKLSVSVLEIREMLKKYQFNLPADAYVEDVLIDSLPAKWVYPKNLSTEKVILYFHGGGYAIGSAESYREFAYQFSKASEAKVLLVDYRLCPEHALTCALEDAIKAYQWLCENVTSPKNIIFAGDSAGGGLALGAIAKLKDMGFPLPKAVIGLCPWTDLLLTGKSLVKNKKCDPYLVMPQKLMLFEGIDLAQPYVSPLYANFKGFPPIYLQTSTIEILLDDSLRLAEKARQASASVTIDIFEGMPHCWQLFSKYLPEGKIALQKVGNFMKNIN